jgi:hypothetical protein
MNDSATNIYQISTTDKTNSARFLEVLLIGYNVQNPLRIIQFKNG